MDETLLWRSYLPASEPIYTDTLSGEHDGLDCEGLWLDYDPEPDQAQAIPKGEGFHHTKKSALEYGITVSPSGLDSSHPATHLSDITLPESHFKDDSSYGSGCQSTFDFSCPTSVSSASSRSSSSSNPRKFTMSMTSQYLCDICSRTFTELKTLHMHHRIIHGLGSHASKARKLSEEQAKVGGIPAELRQSIHSRINKTVPSFILTDPTPPLSRTISTIFESIIRHILSQQAPPGLRQKLQSLSAQLPRSSGDEIENHIIDIICGLYTLHGQGSTGAHETIVECEILYESKFVTSQTFKTCNALASMLEFMRIRQILPVPVALRIKPVTEFNDQHPTPAVNKVGSEDDNYHSDAGPYSTTFLCIKDQRYLVAKFPCYGIEPTLPDYVVTLSRIKDVLLQATDTKEGAFDEEPDQGRKTIHTEKRKRSDGSWFYYDDVSSNAEDEEDDEDSEDEDGAERPSIFPYFFSAEANVVSPADSMASGSNSSGSGNQDTPTSSMSDQFGGSGPHNNAQPTAQGPGTGSPGSQTGPSVEIKNDNSQQVSGRQPLPFICWYPAAGTLCTAKHTKRSADTRYLLKYVTLLFLLTDAYTSI
jgi:hypothetical protein